MRIFLLLFGLLCLPTYAIAEDDEQEVIVEYLELKPKFIINLSEPKKYMRINVQLMVKGEDAVERITKHMPLLRHTLIMTFSGLSAEILRTKEEREKIKTKSFEVLKEALEEHANTSEGLIDVFFTEFLVQ